MEFAGDIAFWQRRIAEITKGAEHRIAAFQALEIVLGETILDIGCGGGALTREIALAVGPEGRAIGLDRSPEQLTAAREVCADVASAELVEADATNLPFDDASVDGFISINTLEYVPQVERALQEAHRVLKAGGRAVVLSVLWDVWKFYGPDPDLNHRILKAWRTHCPHQTLPMELPAMLARAGFGEVQRKPFAVLGATFDEDAYGYWVAKIVASFAVEKGVALWDVQRWLEQLASADAQGNFGFFQVSVLTTAAAGKGP